MRRRLVRGRLVLGCLVLVAGLGWARPASAQGAGVPNRRFVNVVQVNGYLDPVMVDFLEGAIAESERGGAEVLVVQLDSPGSVVSTEVLDALVFRIGHARVPVAVWVGESGAQAQGGAARLVVAAPVAGMAPQTSFGRVPKPVFGELPPAVRNGTLGPQQALDLGLVQLNQEESAVLGSFIAALDGREVGGRALETASFEPVEGGPPRARLTVDARLAKLDLVPRLMHTVASPPVAYLLVSVALALLVFEFFTAGVGVAGVVGAVCGILAAYGLAVLPTSPRGVALMLLGTFGFAVDVQTGVPRFWTGLGVVAFALGSLVLFDGVSIGWLPLVSGVVGMVLLMLAGLPATVRSRFSTPTIGRESMIGEMGEAVARAAPDGVVRIREALWPARTNRATPIAVGDRVRVTGINGPLLEVEPESGGARDYREHRHGTEEEEGPSTDR
ncbi:MAG: NfeD family protein [Acidimicrobiales bacterium]